MWHRNRNVAKLTDEWLICTVALAVMSEVALVEGRHSAVLDGNQASVTSYAAELHNECNTVAGPMPGLRWQRGNLEI